MSIAAQSDYCWLMISCIHPFSFLFSLSLAGVPVQFSEQPTNGITYFRALSSITDIPEDLKPYLPLFCFVLTKYDFESCLSLSPSAYLSVCLSVHLPTCLCVRLSICLPVHLSVCLSIFLPASVSMSVRLVVHLPTCLCQCLYLPTCLSVCLSIYLPVLLSVCLSISLPACVSMSVHLPTCVFFCPSTYLSVSKSVHLPVCRIPDQHFFFVNQDGCSKLGLPRAVAVDWDENGWTVCVPTHLYTS